MNFCPKCGTIINPKDTHCPKCHTQIISDDVEVLDFPVLKKESPEQPKIEKEKSIDKTKKVLKKSSLPKKVKTESKKEKNISKKEIVKIDQDANVTLKPIPLKVKKTNRVSQTKNKEIEEFINHKYSKLNKYYKDEDKLLNISSILKIFIVILLLVITVTIIFSTAIETTKKPQVTVVNEVKKSGDLLGKWQTNNYTMFTFNEDSSFYWYKSAKDLKNNYYGGTYTYKKGDEALVEMGYDEEEFTKTFGQEVNKDNIYSIEMQPTISYENGQNTTDSLSSKTKWWFILIIKQDGTAMAYNKTLDIRYNLIRK